MTIACIDCGGDLELPEDSLKDEIISCPDCGVDYVVVEETPRLLSLQLLTIEGEDWGE
jgi:alpha-aminoadipate carrier protein LysW